MAFFFVAPIGPILGVLLGFVTNPKALMVIWLAVSASHSTSSQSSFRLYENTHFFGPKGLPMKAHSPVEDLNKQVPILMFMET